MVTQQTSSIQQERIQHYQTIGQALLRIEAVSSRVGVPWMFPTRRVRGVQQSVSSEELAELAKQEFVTVSTSALEVYHDDLETLPDDIGSVELLQVKLNSRLEKYGFCALITFFFASSMLAFSISLYQDPGVYILLSLLGGLVGVLLGLDLASDCSRRKSFAALIQREILRRQGLDGDSRNRLSISSVDPNPIK